MWLGRHSKPWCGRCWQWKPRPQADPLRLAACPAMSHLPSPDVRDPPARSSCHTGRPALRWILVTYQPQFLAPACASCCPAGRPQGRRRSSSSLPASSERVHPTRAQTRSAFPKSPSLEKKSLLPGRGLSALLPCVHCLLASQGACSLSSQNLPALRSCGCLPRPVSPTLPSTEPTGRLGDSKKTRGAVRGEGGRGSGRPTSARRRACSA